ncbi:outer membrane beta-barrel protein [Adhaeribacter swui]|uniref:Outer membrane beta-barrel protein n=1 Tax=Adhaeribacter swui TaxID=2086471 RepID=A0A7G7GBJ9_9BACT|nr:outer membrane beta-barrel protein [Adhaeribacter swui]QNF34533.1 outer membrane beta-barrel protein [Adhaeribacter swui]
MFKTFKVALAVSFLFLLQTNSFGQKNFVKGNLYLSAGDTISGYIDDQNWDRNPRTIDFKETPESATQHFTVSQLSGFNLIDGDVYRKAVLQVDKTPTRHQEIIQRPKPFIVTDSVYLLEQVKGTISLYHLLDEANKNHFYILKKDGTLEELIQRLYVTYKNDQPLVGTADQYKNQLKYSILSDNPALFPQIDKATYTKAALISIVENYNKWLDPNKTVEIKKISKAISKLGLVAGGNITNYKFKGQAYDYLLKSQFDWHKNPMVGMFYQILLPRNRHKWSIYNELVWKRSYNHGEFDIQDDDFIFEQDAYYTGKGEVNIKADYIGLTSMFRYSWAHQNFQPFINFGLAGNLGLDINTYVTGQELYKVENRVATREIFKNPSKYELGFVAGGGMKINKVAFEIRAEKGSGYLNSNADVSVRKVMLALLLNYYFN